ncbi:MAG: cytochrome c biogenesis protein CcdA, partial [Armatimonadota bacterium]|nr:cytochrome c biogenesis protein CcdA [Armatimonadota bacterium]
MNEIFTVLSRTLEETSVAALLAAYIWGIISVVLSPCHLSSIPLIVGFISKQGKTTPKRAFGIALFFAIGILTTIAIIGVITASTSRLIGDVGPTANYIVAVIFFIVGLYLLDVIPLPWAGPSISTKTRGFLAAFLLGLLFGIAVGPCTFAYMAPILGITFKIASTHLAYSILLLLAYGIGHCTVIAIIGTSTELVERYLNWNEESR